MRRSSPRATSLPAKTTRLQTKRDNKLLTLEHEPGAPHQITATLIAGPRQRNVPRRNDDAAQSASAEAFRTRSGDDRSFEFSLEPGAPRGPRRRSLRKYSSLIPETRHFLQAVSLRASLRRAARVDQCVCKCLH